MRRGGECTFLPLLEKGEEQEVEEEDAVKRKEKRKQYLFWSHSIVVVGAASHCHQNLQGMLLLLCR